MIRIVARYSWNLRMLEGLWLRPLLVGIIAYASSCVVPSAAYAKFTGMELVSSNLNQPLYVTYAPGDRNRLFVVEKIGHISVVDLASGVTQATPFLAIPDTKVTYESGLVGMTFHPQFSENGKFYVYVTSDNGGVMIDGIASPLSSYVREYTVDPGSSVANATYKTIWSSVRPSDAHVAGWIGFSPVDHYLYVMSGDGGNSFDSGPGHTPETGNAQDITDNHFGKVLRLDVNGDDFPDDAERNYAIPPTNPFVGIEGDDEIWAYGLRNPYRASFDRATGDLWIADVGQGQREEINYQPANSAGGENYGWVLREGTFPGIGGEKPPGNVDPVYDYGRGNPSNPGLFDGQTTFGGFVYRGPDPELQGKYIFGDAPARRFWMLDPANIPTAPGDPPLTVESLTHLFGEGSYPVSFGEDAVGNLYVTFLGSGEVFRLKTDALIPGDFDADGDVDAADMEYWSNGFGMAAGATYDNGDADVDGDVDGQDYLVWQQNFGQQPLTINPAAVQVPEPASLALALALSWLAQSVRCRRS